VAVPEAISQYLAHQLVSFLQCPWTSEFNDLHPAVPKHHAVDKVAPLVGLIVDGRLQENPSASLHLRRQQ
jgi:hypothetical protein